MADQKFSGLNPITVIKNSASIPILQDGANKRIIFSDFMKTINTEINVNTELEDIDLNISGLTDINLFHVKASSDSIGIGTEVPEEKLSVNGSFSSNGIERSKSYNTQTGSGQVDLTTHSTMFDSITAIAITIGNGLEGQKKLLIQKGSGISTLTAYAGTSFGGFTQVEFGAIGNTLSLIYLGTKWWIVESHGVTVS